MKLTTLALCALLMPSAAFGQDTPPDDTVDTGTDPDDPDNTVEGLPRVLPTYILEAPDLAAGISVLPRGSFVITLGEDGTYEFSRLSGKYWIMPDSFYREAVTKAKQLDIYVDALDRCSERALAWQAKTADAYDSCLTTFDTDETLIVDQVQTIATWETKAYSFKDQRDTARRQRNVAWAVTGGILLGAATGIVVAVAP